VQTLVNWYPLLLVMVVTLFVSIIPARKLYVRSQQREADPEPYVALAIALMLVVGFATVGGTMRLIEKNRCLSVTDRPYRFFQI
jgi:hypothetical protein